jgi:hypothetical protein
MKIFNAELDESAGIRIQRTAQNISLVNTIVAILIESCCSRNGCLLGILPP